MVDQTLTDYVLPQEHKDSQKLDFEMEKVKSFLFVKNQTETVNVMESLEGAMQSLLSTFIKKTVEVDLLKRKEQSLEQVIYSLKEEVIGKIAKMEEKTSKIQVIK